MSFREGPLTVERELLRDAEASGILGFEVDLRIFFDAM
jgi:hypothetical protein